jgi:hypothetical protein
MNILHLVRDGVSNPKKALQIIRFEMEIALRKANQYYHTAVGNGDGNRIMDRDWDTCILLDACRYDYFQQESPYDNFKLSKEVSVGTDSKEFIKTVFSDREFHDTVYVTGNPFVSLLERDTFHDIVIDDTWDVGNSQATPTQVTEAALKAHEEYPNKRIIVHYMQPHFPVHHPDFTHINEYITYRKSQHWPVGISRAELRDGYRANLNYVLSHVTELIDDISGKAVITSDHGEMLGERAAPIPVRIYNHFEDLYVSELLDVPWLEVEGENRRNIHAEPPVESIDTQESDEITNRLEALGYR